MKNFLVLSYPRSGSSLMSSYIRAMNKKKDRKDRVHRAGRINGPLLVVVRNYKECIPRHRQEVSKEVFKESLEGMNGKVGYLPILRQFEKCRYPKLLVYYEDMVVNGESAIQTIGEWLRVDQPVIEGVKNDNDQIVKETLSAYDNRQTSFTKGKSLIWHSKKTPDEVNNWVDEYVRDNAPEIFNKYLKRYVHSSKQRSH